MLPLYDVLSKLSDSTLATLGTPPEQLCSTFANKKKYKSVHFKVRPVKAELSKQYRIIRDIKGDSLADLPKLDYAHIPDFTPTGRYTEERRKASNVLHGGEFLLLEERRFLHHFMMLHHTAFTWNDTERGRFKEEFFSPIEFPVIPHTP